MCSTESSRPAGASPTRQRVTPFPRREGPRRRPARPAPPRPHFHEYQYAVILGDYVDLALAAAEVAFADPVALRLQVGGGHPLAEVAQVAAGARHLRPGQACPEQSR